MVLEVVSDGKVDDRLDIKAGDKVGGSDAGELEDLGGADGSSAERETRRKSQFAKRSR